MNLTCSGQCSIPGLGLTNLEQSAGKVLLLRLCFALRSLRSLSWCALRGVGQATEEW